MDSGYTNIAATYQQADLYGGIESADPHRLVEMLLDGLLKHLVNAKIGIHANDMMKKCSAIDKALNILDALRNSLDFEAGEGLAQNLDDLYDYLQRSLVKANYESSQALIEEVASLVGQIKTAWSMISIDDLELEHADKKLDIA